jgi:hypothetical protein
MMTGRIGTNQLVGSGSMHHSPAAAGTVGG